jgi:hypothetical protein
MKTPAQITDDIARRLARSWADEAVHAAGASTQIASLWPHNFPIGRAKSTDLAHRFGEVTRQVAAWRAWSRDHGVPLVEEPRRVSGTQQTLPTHVQIPDADTAAHLVGADWSARLERGRARAKTLRTRFPNFPNTSRILSATDRYSDIDFDLLLRTAEWFTANGATHSGQLTPRQVPVEGLHAKWLNTSQHLVRALADLDDLMLLPPHPARIHFTYLDPRHLATGGRRYDSASVGDTVTLPYTPRVVLISENKDTAVGFPPVPDGVAIEGDGRGAAAHASFAWIREAPALAYWGDMDADGLEILNEFRTAGVAATSLLMDMSSYETWERFGTNTDRQGNPLGPRTPRPVQYLTPGEAELYALLVSSDCTRFRRIEQERIPLHAAQRALHALARDNP